MSIGQGKNLKQDLENPGRWEDITFAFDFSARLATGDAISGTPVVSALTPIKPVGCSSLTIGSRLSAGISGSQVEVSITLADGAISGGTYLLTCLCGTVGGEKLVVQGLLYT